MSKDEELESKIRRAVEQILTLQRENERLRKEHEALGTHVAMLTQDNANVNRILAEHEQRRRAQEQVTLRVERALQKLASLQPAA